MDIDDDDTPSVSSTAASAWNAFSMSSMESWDISQITGGDDDDSDDDVYFDEFVGAGAIKSPDDPNDTIFESLAHANAGFYIVEFPPEFDLRSQAAGARDQGSRGMCAAFTGASIKEIHEAINGGGSVALSPEFIYYHRENKPSSGMYGRNVFQILQTIGTVPEDRYPVREDELAPPPTSDLYRAARKHRISGYARVNTVDGLKRALVELGPCYLQLPLYRTRPYFWRSDGLPVIGGHAVVVVGFTVDGFILQNSWGADWNGDGCIVLPYDEWDTVWECWVPIVGVVGGGRKSRPCSVM